MKKNCWLYLSLTLILAGCGYENVTISSFTSTPTNISSISTTPITQMTPSEVIMISTKTPVSTLAISSLTPTIPLKPTPTFLPAVPDSEREIVLANLLQTNGLCPDKQPCFWGFTPYASNADQMRNYLLSLGNPTGENSFSFTVREKIFITMAYETQKGYVGNLSAKLSGMDWQIITNRDWKAFNVDSIIKNYGEPDDIKFTGGTLEGGNHFFLSFGLVYNKLDLSIMYTSKVLKDLSFMCPLEEQWTDSVEWTFGKGFSIYQGWLDIKDVVGISNQDFINLIQKGGLDACFKINIKSLLP